MHGVAAKAILIALIILSTNELTADDKAKRKPEYPARLKVVSQRFDALGNLHVCVNLEIDSEVRIYANPVGAQGMNHAAAKLTVLDGDGKVIEAKIQYPKGERQSSVFLDDYYLYKKIVSFDIGIEKAREYSRPFTIRGGVAGYNERRSCCLGFAQLDTKLELNEK